MSAVAAFAVAGLATGILSVVLAAAIALRRSLRERSRRRTLALAEPYRQQLVRLVMDDEPNHRQFDMLLSVDERTWRALEPIVVAMVRKLRGEARGALVNLLFRRGTIARHARRLRQHGAVGRARSAELLGLLGEHAPRAELERLLAGDRYPEVRIVAARALGEIGNPQSAPALLAASVGARAVPLRIVARSLDRLGPGAASALVDAMRHSDPTVRAIAAEILGLAGTVTAVGVLASHLHHDPDDDVRIRSARALGRIGVPSAIASLRRCVVPEEPVGLRAVAARAIGDIGGAEAVRLLGRLLADEHHVVASNAARALGGLGPAALTALREVAASAGPGSIYAAEALAMQQLNEPAAARPDAQREPSAPELALGCAVVEVEAERTGWAR